MFIHKKLKKKNQEKQTFINYGVIIKQLKEINAVKNGQKRQIGQKF